MTITPAIDFLNAAASPLNLDSLADNGGPTQTMALGADSVAIGHGNCSTLTDVAPVTTDQRGVSRKALCDIGAFETQTNVSCVAPTGLNICQLQKGDILLGNFPSSLLHTAFEEGFVGTYWTHAALYDGNGNVLQAANESWGIIRTPITLTGFYDNSPGGPKANDWVVLRLKPEYQSAIDGAVAWANTVVDDPNIPFMPMSQWFDLNNKSQVVSFYCALLVWRAFYQQGVDLDYPSGYLHYLAAVGLSSPLLTSLLAQVLPDDLYASAVGIPLVLPPKTDIVQGDPNHNRTLILVFSPVNLRVTDTGGNVTGTEPDTGVVINNIPGAFYSGSDSEPEWVSIPDVNVLPQIEVHGTGSGQYILAVQRFDNQTESADAFVWNTEPGQTDTFTSTNDSTGAIDLVPLQVTNMAKIDGVVQLQGRPRAPDVRWSVPLHVVVTPQGGGAAVFDQEVTTDENGQFELDGLIPGNYQLWIKGDHTLAMSQAVTIVAGANQANIGTLPEGDADGNNVVNLTDFSILAANFGRQTGDPDFDSRADFNDDGVVNLLDFSLLATNFGQAGAE